MFPNPGEKHGAEMLTQLTCKSHTCSTKFLNIFKCRNHTSAAGPAMIALRRRLLALLGRNHEAFCSYVPERLTLSRLRKDLAFPLLPSRRAFSAGAQSHPEDPLSSVPGEEKEYDDKDYFKGLGKSSSQYWMENAESVLQRLDLARILDPRNEGSLRENLRRRYCDDKVKIAEVRGLWERWKASEGDERADLARKFVSLAMWIPNETHPKAMEIESDLPYEVNAVGRNGPDYDVLEFQKYCDKLGLIRNDNLGNLSNHRSYFLKGPLAELEEALLRYALDKVKNAGFQLISVPDIVFPHVIESCGMRTRSERDQVFWLHLPDLPNSEVCLSGTAEMSIGGSLQNLVFDAENLPLKLVAVSRCFRAETSSIVEERGIFRVHDFTKVELFGVTAAENGKGESEKLHEEIKGLEESLFSELGISFKTLEMPPSELGLPASRKFDIEAWMPGRKMFGEISSCSNCTDFQSRRLNIRYRCSKTDNNLKFVHTVNGTAMAIPRMLITLIETCQQRDGSIKLPKPLEPFMKQSWEESLKSNPKYGTLFLRTKGAQIKYTKDYRKLELHT